MKTLKDVNDLVWNNSWKGEVDPVALEQRLKALMAAEKKLRKIQDKIAVLKELLSSSS